MSDTLKTRQQQQRQGQQPVQPVNAAQLEQHKRDIEKQKAADRAAIAQPIQQDAGISKIQATQQVGTSDEQFAKDNVKLNSGEWISKVEYDKLSIANQAVLMEKGVSSYNAYLAEQFDIANKQTQADYDRALIQYNENKATFEANNVKLSTGEYIGKDSYNNLPEYLQTELNKRGVDGFNTLLNNPTALNQVHQVYLDTVMKQEIHDVKLQIQEVNNQVNIWQDFYNKHPSDNRAWDTLNSYIDQKNNLQSQLGYLLEPPNPNELPSKVGSVTSIPTAPILIPKIALPLNATLQEKIAYNLAMEGYGTGQIISKEGYSGEKVLAQQQAQAIQLAQIQAGISPSIFAKGSAVKTIPQGIGTEYVRLDNGLMVAKDAVEQLPAGIQEAINDIIDKETYVLVSDGKFTLKATGEELLAATQAQAIQAAQIEAGMTPSTFAVGSATTTVPTLKSGEPISVEMQEAFKNLQVEGKVPDYAYIVDAQYKDGSWEFQLGDSRPPQQIFNKMLSNNEIPEGSKMLSYTKYNEQYSFAYQPPETQQSKDVKVELTKYEYADKTDGKTKVDYASFAYDSWNKGKTPEQIESDLKAINLNDDSVAAILQYVGKSGFANDVQFKDIVSSDSQLAQYKIEHPDDPRLYQEAGGLPRYLIGTDTYAKAMAVEKTINEPDFFKKFQTMTGQFQDWVVKEQIIDKTVGAVKAFEVDLQSDKAIKPIQGDIPSQIAATIQNISNAMRGAEGIPPLVIYNVIREITGDKIPSATSIMADVGQKVYDFNNSIDLNGIADNIVTQARGGLIIELTKGKTQAESDKIVADVGKYMQPVDAVVTGAATLLSFAKFRFVDLPVTGIAAALDMSDNRVSKAVEKAMTLATGLIFFPVQGLGEVSGAISSGQYGKATGLVGGAVLGFVHLGKGKLPEKVVELSDGTKARIKFNEIQSAKGISAKDGIDIAVSSAESTVKAYITKAQLDAPLQMRDVSTGASYTVELAKGKASNVDVKYTVKYDVTKGATKEALESTFNKLDKAVQVEVFRKGVLDKPVVKEDSGIKITAEPVIRSIDTQAALLKRDASALKIAEENLKILSDKFSKAKVDFMKPEYAKLASRLQYAKADYLKAVDSFRKSFNELTEGLTVKELTEIGKEIGQPELPGLIDKYHVLVKELGDLESQLGKEQALFAPEKYPQATVKAEAPKVSEIATAKEVAAEGKEIVSPRVEGKSVQSSFGDVLISLPKVKEGFKRVIHRTSPELALEITRTGLKIKPEFNTKLWRTLNELPSDFTEAKKAISSYLGDSGQGDIIMGNVRKGAFVVMDIPEAIFKEHFRGKGKEGSVVNELPAEYVVASMEYNTKTPTISPIELNMRKTNESREKQLSFESKFQKGMADVKTAPVAKTLVVESKERQLAFKSKFEEVSKLRQELEKTSNKIGQMLEPAAVIGKTAERTVEWGPEIKAKKTGFVMPEEGKAITVGEREIVKPARQYKIGGEDIVFTNKLEEPILARIVRDISVEQMLEKPSKEQMTQLQGREALEMLGIKVKGKGKATTPEYVPVQDVLSKLNEEYNIANKDIKNIDESLKSYHSQVDIDEMVTRRRELMDNQVQIGNTIKDINDAILKGKEPIITETTQKEYGIERPTGKILPSALRDEGGIYGGDRGGAGKKQLAFAPTLDLTKPAFELKEETKTTREVRPPETAKVKIPKIKPEENLLEKGEKVLKTDNLAEIKEVVKELQKKVQDMEQSNRNQPSVKRIFDRHWDLYNKLRDKVRKLESPAKVEEKIVEKIADEKIKEVSDIEAAEERIKNEIKRYERAREKETVRQTGEILDIRTAQAILLPSKGKQVIGKVKEYPSVLPKEYPENISVGILGAPKKQPKTISITTPAISPEEYPSTKTEMQLQAAPQLKTSTAVQTKVMEQVETKPAVETKPQVETKTKTAVKTTTVIPAKFIIKTPILKTPTEGKKIIKKFPPKPEEKYKKLSAAQKKSVLAYKQGFIYVLRYGLYRDKIDVIYSRKPIGGVKYYKGIGSAQKSVELKGGSIVKDLEFDQGAIDLMVGKTVAGTKPKLRYIKDIQYGNRGSRDGRTGSSNSKKAVRAKNRAKSKGNIPALGRIK